MFSNVAPKSFNTGVDQPDLLIEAGLQELPVIMMILVVRAKAGQKVGTLIDLDSDTSFITHEVANKLSLKSEDITLIVHGVGGMKIQVQTKHP